MDYYLLLVIIITFCDADQCMLSISLHVFFTAQTPHVFSSMGLILYSTAAAIVASSGAAMVMDCRKAVIDRATHSFTHTNSDIHCALRKGQAQLTLIHYGHCQSSHHLSRSRGGHRFGFSENLTRHIKYYKRSKHQISLMIKSLQKGSI